MFDKKDGGYITEDELVKILQNKRGEPLDDDEIKAMYKGKPPIEGGEAFSKSCRTSGCRNSTSAIPFSRHNLHDRSVLMSNIP